MNTTPRPHPEHLTHPKYRADIDGIRAIAILIVVGFHAFPTLVKGGFIGVDIFFVISGFLISTIIIGSLERNSFSFITFYTVSYTHLDVYKRQPMNRLHPKKCDNRHATASSKNHYRYSCQGKIHYCTRQL